eukprot:CAMPEP_0197576116 /NCGR_PEP_ID=MMETSP1326-20131121/1255_1 /TAXON_ID=1155430 /ORGANISM="Genus nov. species nov., Strain RCC2288" /LENGTH=167 /DNA_ID=CAMNT_0043138975 /DNA_START=444 /DNA_END=948 /DNA_ORIENTATION=+
MTPSSLYLGAKSAFDMGLKPFLPTAPPARVLDIGCGLALYDYFMFEHFNFDSRVHIYLFDKTTNDIEDASTFVGGGWNPTGKFSFYTSLTCASEILKNNTGLPYNIHPVVASKVNIQRMEEESFDVIYSLLSYGHHYPVSTYLDDVFRLLRSGGTLVLDLRAKGKVI